MHVNLLCFGCLYTHTHNMKHLYLCSFSFFRYHITLSCTLPPHITHIHEHHHSIDIVMHKATYTISTLVHTHSHSPTHILTHTHTLTLTHTHTHTHTHSHTYTLTHTQDILDRVCSSLEITPVARFFFTLCNPKSCFPLNPYHRLTQEEAKKQYQLRVYVNTRENSLQFQKLCPRAYAYYYEQVCVYVYMHACVCVCVCFFSAHIWCVCVCVCVCVCTCGTKYINVQLCIEYS